MDVGHIGRVRIQAHFGTEQETAKEAQALSETDQGAGPQPRPLRALIVDDELLVVMYMEALLEEVGCEVAAVAANGETAIRLARETRPDVVLMDVNLGLGIDGIQAASTIRETFAGQIVFATAYRDPTTIERIRSRVPGAQILSKPVLVDDIKRVLNRH